MPRIAKSRPTRRLNLELSEAVRDRLEELRDEIGADSITEVVRRALSLYDYVWTQNQEGNEIVLRGEDKESVVEFF